MTEVSIWRWAVTDDLVQRFAALVAADSAEFARLAAEMAQDEAEDFPSLDALERETEAKLRAMDLPPDIMETMMKGFHRSMQEAREEEAADEAEDAGDFGPDAQGRMGVALASSHMFYDDPYASLGYEEIDRQVAMQSAAYREAISTALGNAGQSLSAYLGLSDAQLYNEDVCDVLMAAELESVTWVWVTQEVVYALAAWHEDKELPIDLDFARIPRAMFETAKARLAAAAQD